MTTPTTMEERVGRVEVGMDGLRASMQTIIERIEALSATQKVNWGWIFGAMTLVLTGFLAATTFMIRAEVGPAMQATDDNTVRIRAIESNLTAMSASHFTDTDGQALRGELYKHLIDAAYWRGTVDGQLGRIR